MIVYRFLELLLSTLFAFKGAPYETVDTYFFSYWFTFFLLSKGFYVLSFSFIDGFFFMLGRLGVFGCIEVLVFAKLVVFFFLPSSVLFERED